MTCSKKTRYKKPIVIKNQIKEFYNKVKQFKLDDIICIDETSLNSFMILYVLMKDH